MTPTRRGFLGRIIGGLTALLGGKRASATQEAPQAVPDEWLGLAKLVSKSPYLYNPVVGTPDLRSNPNPWRNLMLTWTPCARCGNDDHDAERESVHLFGGYVAVLCYPCQNAWSEALMKHRCWRDQQEVEARKVHLVGRARAGDAPSLEEWRELVVAEDAVKEATFHFATDWVAAGMPATEPAPPEAKV